MSLGVDQIKQESAELMIQPIMHEGELYYAAIVSPRAARHIRAERAAFVAMERFAGRDWRRIKREMNRAGRKARVKAATAEK